MYYIHSLYNVYLCTVYNFTFMYSVQLHLHVQCTVTFMYSVQLYYVQRTITLCTVYNSVHLKYKQYTIEVFVKCTM